jgi:hypothetical protein
MVSALTASDRFQIIFANEDAIIFVLVPTASETPP